MILVSHLHAMMHASFGPTNRAHDTHSINLTRLIQVEDFKIFVGIKNGKGNLLLLALCFGRLQFALERPLSTYLPKNNSSTAVG